MVTDSNGATQELTDYQPFGAIVYTSENSSVDNHYRFTGKELDSETALQYFGARYMDNSLGRFTSVDPILLEMHDPDKVKGYGWTQKALLSEPQLLNSYAYSRNNPIVLTDPQGKIIPLLVGWAAIYGFPAALSTIAAVGASIASAQLGQALGYAQAGDTAKSTEMAERSIATSALTGAGVEGMMAIGEVFSSKTPSRSANSQPVQSRLPDDALACRGGLCTSDRFREGSGVSINGQGKLEGASVYSDPSKSIDELSQEIRHSKIGVTNVGAIRNLGGDVVSTPRGSYSSHATMSGITPEQAESLFTPVGPNPRYYR